MSVINFILWLAFGGLAGWIARQLMREKGSLVWNIVLGAAGSLIGGFVARLLGISTSRFSIGALAIAVGGACLTLFIVRKLKK